jgi:multisubunit Na+/H+ antiporter MnhG subunit
LSGSLKSCSSHSISAMLCSAFIRLPHFFTTLHARTRENGSLIKLDQCGLGGSRFCPD